MKSFKWFSIVMTIVLLAVAVIPVSAQLGSKDVSSFTIMNISGAEATVSVMFVAEDGTQFTPAQLNKKLDGTYQVNPFVLAAGASFEIYTPGIVDLPNGRYSVVISSSEQVVATANLAGQGTVNYNGAYSGFSGGSNTFYLADFMYNYYGWYSVLTVQNVGDVDTDVDLEITCTLPAVGKPTTNPGYFAVTGLKAGASVTFDTKAAIPTGWTTANKCSGSVKVTSTSAPVVAVETSTIPATGDTQTFNGETDGYTSLYMPLLYNSYYGWVSSINVRKLDAGDTQVTIAFSDAEEKTCDLTDISPSCMVYLPSVLTGKGLLSATITSDNANHLLAIGNAGTISGNHQASSYNAIPGGSSSVNVVSVFKWYYGWVSSTTCQNIGNESTKLIVAYDGYAPYTTVKSVDPGKTMQIYQPSESFLPNKYYGGMNISVEVGKDATLSCIVAYENKTNIDNKIKGDWSMANNTFIVAP